MVLLGLPPPAVLVVSSAGFAERQRRSTLPSGPGETRPTHQEREPADRSDRAERAHTGQVIV